MGQINRSFLNDRIINSAKKTPYAGGFSMNDVTEYYGRLHPVIPCALEHRVVLKRRKIAINNQ